MLLDRVTSLLVPPACWACRRPAPPGQPLCRDCRAQLPWLDAPCCSRCALPAPCGGASTRPCPARHASFDRSWAAVAHAGPARRLVAALKFHGALPVADALAAQMAATLPPALLDGATIVPVPGDPRRAARRGLDHAALLAAALAQRAGRPTTTALRRRAGPRQAGATRAQRLTTGRLTIEAQGRAPAIALLIDDVHTTGATLDACGSVLRAAGTTDVRAITYARTLP